MLLCMHAGTDVILIESQLRSHSVLSRAAACAPPPNPPEQSPPGQPHSHTAATLPGILQTLLAAWQSELLYMEYLTPSYQATSPARGMQHLLAELSASAAPGTAAFRAALGTW